MNEKLDMKSAGKNEKSVQVKANLKDTEIMDLNEPDEKKPTDKFQMSDIDKKMNEMKAAIDSKNEGKSDENPEHEGDKQLSDFDSLFDNLYNDVVGANDFISNLIEKDTSLNQNSKSLKEIKEKLDQEKADFARYAEEQREIIKQKKEQCDEYVAAQRHRIEKEEIKFNEIVSSKKTELDLVEQSLNLVKEQLDSEQQQFNEYRNLEEEKIKKERKKLEGDQKQFENEKSVIEKGLKDRQDNLTNDENAFAKYKDLEKTKLDTQKEQFAKYKEVEEKKIELGNQHLTQRFERFKALVSQFNTSFSQIPNDKK